MINVNQIALRLNAQIVLIAGTKFGWKTASNV